MRDREGVLYPYEVPGAMAEAVLHGAAALADALVELGKDPLRVVGMQVLDPEFGIVAHLPRGVAHGGLQVVADEGAGEVARDLRRIDHRRARGDERLQVLHDGQPLAKRALGLLAVGDIGPRADNLERLAGRDRGLP